MNKQVLRLALPNIISNIAVPLAGMIDLALMGYLDGAVNYVAAISLGGMIFSFIYATFIFLRMTTTGFTAQAYGRRDFMSCTLTLVRSLVLAVLAALALLVLQVPLERLVFSVLSTEPEVAALAREYFYIRIWAAPATIGLFSLLGWFIGMQNAKTPMLVALLVNLLNLSFSALFILVFDMQSAGVALGTVLAQYSGLCLALTILIKYYRRHLKRFKLQALCQFKEIIDFFRVSRDVLIRTICLVGVFTFFTMESAAAGKQILAVNNLLLQFLVFFSYLIDGFAYAAEALTGKFIGAGKRKELKLCVACLFKWGRLLALVFVLFYFVVQENILYLLTDDKQLIALAKDYIVWTIILPLSGYSAYLWDGIYVGATASRSIRNAMLLSVLGVFVPVYFVGHLALDNHALWLALTLFMFSRGFFLRAGADKSIYNHPRLLVTKD
jgi:MATE family multidrug resistance protein